jgi:hypothetical protein
MNDGSRLSAKAFSICEIHSNVSEVGVKSVDLFNVVSVLILFVFRLGLTDPVSHFRFTSLS